MPAGSRNEPPGGKNVEKSGETVVRPSSLHVQRPRQVVREARMFMRRAGMEIAAYLYCLPIKAAKFLCCNLTGAGGQVINPAQITGGFLHDVTNSAQAGTQVNARSMRSFPEISIEP